MTINETPVIDQTQPSGATQLAQADNPHPTIIKAIGLGGGGCNAIDRMVVFGIAGVEFIAANTDSQSLAASQADKRILLGPNATRGLGAGGSPEQGELAARESRDLIGEALWGADMIFLACGMGGGTGTGAIPVVAEIARETGAVTIAVVTTPFSFEGSCRLRDAQTGLAKLRNNCDTLITVPNDRLLNVVKRDVSLDIAFRVADDVLRQGIQGIAELITRPGMINVDFAHVRSLMQLAGGALLAVGQGSGASKAMDAIDLAMNHPLLDTASIEQAAGILIHFTGGDDLTLFELSQAVNSVTNMTGINTEIVFGATVEPEMTGRAQVIMVATGVGGQTLEEVLGEETYSEQPSFLDAPKAVQPESDDAIDETSKAPQNEQIDEVSPPSLGEFKPDPRTMEWIVAEPVAAVLDNIDMPAFLRRRKMRDIRGEDPQKEE